MKFVKEEIQTDVLVIGGGIAGIAAAMEASENESSVVLVCKGPFGKDGAVTWMAGGGYQAVLNPPDSVEQHFKDTVIAGRFLCNQKLTFTLLELAPTTVKQLEKWGMRWKKEKGIYAQVRLPGHTYARSMLHVKEGVHFGGELRRVLPKQIRRRDRVSVVDDTFVVELLKKDERVGGALALNLRTGEYLLIRARNTILATGGYMNCFKFATASPFSTGDGHAMALRAGAYMTAMEFVQFFPVAVLWPASVKGDAYPYGMIYEIFGVFYNRLGERFMERYYPEEKDFTTRAKQARAIYKEVREGRGSPHGGAYLSFRHLPRNLIENYIEPRSALPFFMKLKEEGFDFKEDAIEVGPAAHYVCGGCYVNEKCETNVQGLYAIGEVAGGKDGADRLGGNALPFCMASGFIAGRNSSLTRLKERELPAIEKSAVEEAFVLSESFLTRSKGKRPVYYKSKIQDLMESYVKFGRTEEGINRALSEIKDLKSSFYEECCLKNRSRVFNLEWIEALQVRNMLDVCEMVIRSALARKESRGLHERDDFQQERSEYLKHTIVFQKGEEMVVEFKDVEFPYFKPEEGGAK